MAEALSEHDTVYALAAAPDYLNGGRCFAARASGLYVSEDGARTWRDAYHSLQLQTPLTTAAVALSPQYRRDGLGPADGKGTLYAGALGGILRSVDGGDTWTVATLPTPPPYVISIVVSPNYEEDGLAFAGTMEDGVFRSWDRGASWAAWNFGLLDLNVYALAISPDFAHDETLYAGTESGIFRSTNGGRAWREVPFPMEYAPVLALALSPSFDVDGVIFAGTESHGVFHSDDGGATWGNVFAWEEPPAVNQLLLAADFSDSRSIIALAGLAVCHSSDGGLTWRELPIGERLDAAPTCVLTPRGHEQGAPLLIGLEDGRVLVTAISAY